MNWIHPDDLTHLCKQRSGVHVSLLMPLERESDKRQANRIRLKNLIKQGRQQLAADDFLPANIALSDEAKEQLFQPAEALLQDGRYLPENDQNSQGLAIFLGQEMHQIYHVPLPLEEAVVVGPRFYIRPLLPLLGDNGRFYLLQLSQNEVKLWHGTQFELEPVEVPDLPASLADALALEDPEREMQFHTSTQPGRDRPAIFHGHDAEKEKHGAILRFCREVNQAVQQQLKGEEAPLLLASVDYLLPIYEEVNTYSQLLNEAVSGNPEHLKSFELRERAWPIVQRHFAQAKEAALAQYEKFGGTENTSQQLQDIVPAAAYGRVDTLFVAQDHSQQWGRFAPDSGELEMCAADAEAAYTCEDLLNVAATQTLLHGGTSYVVPDEEMPGQANMVAILRYSVS